MLSLLMPTRQLTLLPQLIGPALQIESEVSVVLCRVAAGDDPGRVGEEEVHLFEGLLLSLGEEKVEKDTFVLDSWLAGGPGR